MSKTLMLQYVSETQMLDAYATTEIAPGYCWYTEGLPVTFEVACWDGHDVNFYVADEPFDDVGDAILLPAETRCFPASGGVAYQNLFVVDPLGKPFIACTVTNNVGWPIWCYAWVTSEPRSAGAYATLPAASVGVVAGWIGDQSVWDVYHSGEVLAHMQLLKAYGVDWIRQDITWPMVEETEGVFDWSRTDPMMEQLATAELEMLCILAYTPAWASTGGDWNDPPDDPADFAAYAAAVAARYGPGGAFWTANPGLTPAPITAWEIWNEPYGEGFWQPAPSPADYAALALATAAALHAVDADCTVLVSGNLYQYPLYTTSWIASVLDAEPTLYAAIDGYAVHAYGDVGTESPYAGGRNGDGFRFNMLHQTHRLLSERGELKPIWMTESGWTTAGASAVSEALQAQYVVEAAQRCLVEWDFVERVFFYAYFPDMTPAASESGFGWLHADLTPKTVVAALAAVLG